MEILVVDDDEEVRRHVVAGLGAGGHQVRQAADAAEALRLATALHFDAIVLDRLLPDRDGITVVRELRRAANATPVLMLTTVGDIDARVEGIDAGADDYLVKPFAFVELRARLQAICRRRIEAVTLLQVADLALDVVARTVTRGGVDIPLQPREFALLEYFMRHCDELVTRAMLLQNVWMYHFDPQTSVVETHISRLRGKMDRGFGSGELLETVRGEGYMLRSAPLLRAG